MLKLQGPELLWERRARLAQLNQTCAPQKCSRGLCIRLVRLFTSTERLFVLRGWTEPWESGQTGELMWKVLWQKIPEGIDQVNRNREVTMSMGLLLCCTGSAKKQETDIWLESPQKTGESRRSPITTLRRQTIWHRLYRPNWSWS